MHILVRNLSRTTKEETIRALFEPFGEIASLNIVLDEQTGQSKGFGFVEMPEAAEATAAIKQLNGAKVDGAVIRVKPSESRRPL